MGIRYLGSWQDYSGYGGANRADIVALFTAQVDITTELVVQVPERSHYGWTGELCKTLQDRDIPYKIKIMHITPDMYPRYMEKGKYHIGRLFWETDKLPHEWVEACNKMGEIWASSSSMSEVFKASGVKVPIYWFPEPLDITEADKQWGQWKLPNHKGFLFYSIFQWIERKNPKGLVMTYWDAFQGREDVSLLLKTYRITYDKLEYEKIIADIQQWKKEKMMKHYPKVYVAMELLTHDETMRVHTTGDCYVSADRGEGWSRPIQEALLMGKPVISTARGGIHEYLNNDLYFPIPSEYVPVTEVSWIPWYRKDQNWAKPNLEKLKQAMLFVFANRDVAKAKGIVAKDNIKDRFNYHHVGLAMRKRLEDIERGL